MRYRTTYERTRRRQAALGLQASVKPHNDAVGEVFVACTMDVTAWNESIGKTAGGVLQLLIEKDRRSQKDTLVLKGNIRGEAFTIARVTACDDGTLEVRFHFAENRPVPITVERLQRTIRNFDPHM